MIRVRRKIRLQRPLRSRLPLSDESGARVAGINLRHTPTGGSENKSWLEAIKNRWELFDKTRAVAHLSAVEGLLATIGFVRTREAMAAPGHPRGGLPPQRNT